MYYYRFINSSIENPLALFSDDADRVSTADLPILLTFEKAANVGTPASLWLIAVGTLLVIGWEAPEFETLLLLLLVLFGEDLAAACLHVRRPSDRSAISSSCLGLISVWVNKWVFKFDRWLKHLWQMGQRIGVSSMWRILWTANVLDWQNPLPHSLHLKGFSFECIYRWSRRWSCLRNAFLQISHEYGRSSVWVRSWINKLYDFVNSRWQYLQIKRFFGLEARPGPRSNLGS